MMTCLHPCSDKAADFLMTVGKGTYCLKKSQIADFPHFGRIQEVLKTCLTTSSLQRGLN